MRRFFLLLFTLGFLTAACGGSSSDDTADSTGDSVANSTANDATNDEEEGSESADDNTDDSADESAGGDTVADDSTDDLSGGGAEQGLVETLGLAECPTGVDLAAEGPIEVVFWHPYTALVEEAMHDLANDFNASQDDIVVTVEAQGTYGELLSKYRESISFDSLPDIAIFDSQAVRDVVDSGTILPAQSCIEADDFPLDNIDEAVRANYSLDGALYPWSMNVSAPLIY